MTQSIIETRKAKEVETIHKDLSSQLKEIGNIEQINLILILNSLTCKHKNWYFNENCYHYQKNSGFNVSLTK